MFSVSKLDLSYDFISYRFFLNDKQVDTYLIQVHTSWLLLSFTFDTSWLLDLGFCLLLLDYCSPKFYMLAMLFEF